MFKINVKILDELNIEDVFLESISAKLSICKGASEFSYVVFLNDLHFKLKDWINNSKNEDFIFEDSMEMDYIFGIKKIAEKKYMFEGYNGISFEISSIDSFCSQMIDAMKLAYISQGANGEEYYKELCDLSVKYID